MAPATTLLVLALLNARLKPVSPRSAPPAADAAGTVQDQRDQELLTAIQIQGNVATSDDEVRRLAGVEIGMAVGAETVEAVAARLRAAKRFERVEVRQRFASIADPTQIVLIIIVDEGPVRIEMTGDPNNPTRVVKSRRPNLLFLPILDAEDGYGLTYGVQLAKPGVAGSNSRLSFPLSWGGDRRAGVELDKMIERGVVSRLRAGGSISERTNPFFDRDDDRRQAWLRAEHQFSGAIRAGASAGWQHVSFLGADGSFTHEGLDLIVDTRLDPFLARNAVYARAAWDRFNLAGAGTNRSQFEARGYLGLIGQSIVMLRVARDGSDKPLPPYLRPLLGGSENVRGFAAGTGIGDTLVTGSAELLVPLSSPFSFGKFGLSTFADAGAIYDKGERLADQVWRRGLGGGIWFSAAFARVSVDVAHGVGSSTRFHVGGAVSF